MSKNIFSFDWQAYQITLTLILLTLKKLDGGSGVGSYYYFLC